MVAVGDLIEAKAVIKNNQIVTNNYELYYIAGDSIILLNEFEEKKEANFLANIEICVE